MKSLCIVAGVLLLFLNRISLFSSFPSMRMCTCAYAYLDTERERERERERENIHTYMLCCTYGRALHPRPPALVAVVGRNQRAQVYIQDCITDTETGTDGLQHTHQYRCTLTSASCLSTVIAMLSPTSSSRCVWRRILVCVEEEHTCVCWRLLVSE